MIAADPALPGAFCWTRFGVEAGEPVEHILARKERERHLAGGVFLWGVGSPVGTALRVLAHLHPHPEVLFSPIGGSPQLHDRRPESVVRWLAAEDPDGVPFPLPVGAVVTSRVTLRSRRYALVCYREEPLRLDLGGPRLCREGLRNLLSGAPVGSSQVTAVVIRDPGWAGPADRGYPVALRAQLVPPYLVRLRDPTPI